MTILEVVLGIDNIIFLSLVVDKLPQHQQNKARRLGLMGAMLIRLGLLASIAWVVRLTNPLCLPSWITPFSARDLILMATVVIAGAMMMFAVRTIGEFADRHPSVKSVKMLALAFLILVGLTLILGVWDACTKRLHLFCDVLLNGGRAAKSDAQQEKQSVRMSRTSASHPLFLGMMRLLRLTKAFITTLFLLKWFEGAEN